MEKIKDIRWIKASVLWAGIISLIAYFSGYPALNGLAILSILLGVVAYASGRDYSNPKEQKTK